MKQINKQTNKILFTRKKTNKKSFAFKVERAVPYIEQKTHTHTHTKITAKVQP